MVIRYPCVLLVDTPEFSFETQLVQPSPGCLMTFCHIAVHRWTKGTLRSLKDNWKRIRPTLPPVVFAHGQNPNDAKWEKFVTHFGFTHLTDGLCHDGRERRIFINGL